MELLLVRPTRRRGGSEESYLLLTLGVAFAISAAALYFFGRDSRSLPGIGGEGSVVLMDAALRIHAISLVVIASLIMVLLRLFYNRTLIGLSMMAASIDEDGAATVGIDVPLMRSLTFLAWRTSGRTGGCTGLATHYRALRDGTVAHPEGFCRGHSGRAEQSIRRGGGRLDAGLIESIAVLSVSSGYKDVIAMTLLIVIMIFMPHGMLGKGARKGG
jgi:branched-chain amino acid transport system permease protein